MSFFLLALFISLMRSENFISMNADQDWLETSRREIRGIFWFNNIITSAAILEEDNL